MPADVGNQRDALGRFWGRRSLFDLLATAVTLIITLAPVLLLTAVTLFAFFARENLDWLSLAMPVGRRWSLLINSIGLAAGTAVGAMLIGAVGAFLLWLLPAQFSRLKSLFIWLLLSLVALPPYIHALAWLRLTGGLGISRWLSGWLGVIWVEVATFAPLAAGFTWLGLRSIEPAVIAAGRVLRTDEQTLWRVALPLALPSLLTGGGIIFLLNLLDYSVPSLFGVNGYAMEIFAEYSASHSPERAFLSSLPLLLCGVGGLVLLLRPLPHVVSRPGSQAAAWAAPVQLGWRTASFGRVLGGVLLAQALLPFATLLLTAGDGGLGMTLVTLRQAVPEIQYSLGMSGLAGLASLVLAYGAARSLLRAGGKGGWLWLGILLPVAIPSALVGIGWTVLAGFWPRWLGPLRQLLPVLAVMTRFLPLAVLVMLAWQRRTDPLLFDAALVFPAPSRRRWRQVYLPLLAPGGLAALATVLALSLGELGATLLVIPPGSATLTLRLYNYLHYGASDTVAVLGLLLAGAILLLGGVVSWFNRW